MPLTRPLRLRALPLVLIVASSCEKATSIPDADYRLEVVQPTSAQTALVLAATPVAPTVRVTTTAGAPVAGVVVAFAPTTGAGNVQQRIDTTAADGTATALIWTLGPRAGAQELRAFLPATSNAEFAVFTATATAAPATSMSVTPAFVVLGIGDSAQFTPVFRDFLQNVALPPTPVTFVSSDTLVARVSATGMARATGPGTASITITSGTLSRVASVGVPSGAPTVLVDSFPAPPAGRFAINPAGVAYLSNPNGGWITRYDANTGAVTDSVDIGFSTHDVALDPTGTVAFVSAHPGSIHVIDVATNTRSRTIPMPSFPMRLLVSPDGAWLYASLESGAVVRMNTTTDAYTSVSFTADLVGMALNAGGDRLYVASLLGGVRSLSLPGFATLSTLNTYGQPNDVALSPDGARLYIARGVDSLEARRTSDLSRIAVATGASFANRAAVTPNGRYLVVASTATSSVRILDANTLQLYQTIAAVGVESLGIDQRNGDVWVMYSYPLALRLRFP